MRCVIYNIHIHQQGKIVTSLKAIPGMIVKQYYINVLLRVVAVCVIGALFLYNTEYVIYKGKVRYDTRTAVVRSTYVYA